MPGDPTRELIAVGEPTHAAWFFAADWELNYPLPSFDTELTFAGGQYRLTIRAKSLLRDMCVFADRLDPGATVSEQIVTLLPGEAFTFEIRLEKELTKEQLASPLILRCVNLFCAL